jgi:sensor domain CHASE-containing protein/nitrogen-specific signal transduction histidine kinase/CheY-like chemotaxis protein
MTLRKRVLIIVSATTVGLITVLYAISHFVIIDSFADLEREKIQQNVRRVENALSEAILALDLTTFDWAAWDDTYAFAEDGNSVFIESNLLDAALDSTGLRLNVIMFTDATDRIVYAKGFDLQNSLEVSVPAGLKEHLSRKGLLNHPETVSKVRGVVMLPAGPMLIASRPNLTSEEEGPIRGALIMGRYLGPGEIARLAEVTQLQISIHRSGATDLSPDVQLAFTHLAQGETVFVSALDATTIAGYALLKDIYGEPALTIRVKAPRDIYSRGQSTVSYFVLFLLGSGLVCGGVIFWGMEYVVLRRLAGLADAIKQIGDSQSLSRRVKIEGQDELSQLGSRVNSMLDELETSEQKLVRLERLGALGEMAAGISHNLNNILTGIWGPILLIQDETDNSEILHHADTIRKSAERAADLVKRINRTVKGGREDSGPVDVNAVVQEAVRNARPRWKDEAESRGISIQVVTELQGSPYINGSHTEFHDVLTNLLFNAIEAMPQSGEIRITTDVIDDRLNLVLTDTGVGMDEETRRRVFEPFFTTKVDIGTGLGMSTVHSTIVNWGGRIDIWSDPGQGTRVMIVLPALATALPAPVERAASEVGEGGRVLIVDDEADIRQLFTKFLAKDHHVDSAPDARGALDILDKGSYDVALIDLGLPDMAGDQLADEIRQRDPKLSTVLITGWDLDEDDPRISNFDFELKKPLRNLAQIRSIVGKAVALRRASNS